MNSLIAPMMVGYIALFVPPLRLISTLVPAASTTVVLAAGALVKALPIAMLAMNALSSGGSVSLPLGLGLLLSAGGDVLLDLQDANADLFPLGLGCFLLAHIAYIFWMRRAFNSLGHSLLFGLAFTLLPIVMLRVLWFGLPADLRVPVGVYATVIALMGYQAATAHAPPELLRGALIFLLSDTILAVNEFGPRELRTPSVAKLLVMITYYAAQSMLARAGHIAASQISQKRRA